MSTVWWPALKSWPGANSDLIQAVEALLQIVLLIGGGLLAMLGLRRLRQEQATRTIESAAIFLTMGKFYRHLYPQVCDWENLLLA